MDIRTELGCIICGSLLCDPRVLNCQHLFCLKCLFCLVGKDEADSGISVKCPYSCGSTIVEEGGVKSLKKNHRIGSMALAFRKADFTKAMAVRAHLAQGGKRTPALQSPTRRSPTMKFPQIATVREDREGYGGATNEEEQEEDDLFCEWCTQGLPMPADISCVTCGTFICRRCNEDSTCDHSFLCCPDATKEAPVVGSGDPTSMATATALPVYFGLEEAKQQVLVDLLRKRPHLEGQVTFSAEDCELVYAPFFQCEAKCSAAGDLKQTYPVNAPAEDLDPVIHVRHLTDPAHVQFPTKSDELILLHEIQCCMALSRETAWACTKVLSSMIPAIKISVTAEEINVMDTLAKSVQMVIRVDQLCFRPMCQRLTLIASVLGYADLEVLQQPIMGEAYATRRLRMQRRVELLQTLSAESGTTVTRMTEEANDAYILFQNEYRRYLQVATDRGTKGFTRCNSQQRNCILSLPDLAKIVLQIVERMTVGKSRLTQLYSDHLSLMLRRSAVSAEEKEKFLKEESTISATSYALESLCALEKQVRMLWAKTKSTLSVDLEEVPVMPSAVEKAATESREEEGEEGSQAEAITSLVSSLMPQIQTIRDQHMELIHSNPNQITQHQNLQGQLRSLMIQTLELFQREHSLRLREAHDQEMSHSFVYAHGFLDSLKASGALPRCLGLKNHYSQKRAKPLQDQDDSQIGEAHEEVDWNDALQEGLETGSDSSDNPLQELFAPLPHSLAKDQIAFTRILSSRTQLLVSKLEEAEERILLQKSVAATSGSSGSHSTNDHGSSSTIPFFSILDSLRTFYGTTVNHTAYAATAGSGNNNKFPAAADVPPPPPPRHVHSRSIATGTDEESTGADQMSSELNDAEQEEEGEEDDEYEDEYREVCFVDPGCKIRVLRSNGNGPSVRKAAMVIGKKVFKVEFPKAKSVEVTCSSKVPKPLLLPVFIGIFYVEGDIMPYSFTVSAQVLGATTFDLPPLRGLRRVKATSMSLLSSPSVFVAANTAVMTGFVVVSKVLQLLAWSRRKKN